MFSCPFLLTSVGKYSVACRVKRLVPVNTGTLMRCIEHSDMTVLFKISVKNPQSNVVVMELRNLELIVLFTVHSLFNIFSGLSVNLHIP